MIINNEIESKEQTEECFICLEERENEICIPLNSMKEYSKYCHCNGNIHKSCLDNWYIINPKCPICRNTMIKNPEYILKYINCNENLMCMYFCFIKYLLIFIIILRFAFVVFIIFLISDKVIIFYHSNLYANNQTIYQNYYKHYNYSMNYYYQ
jgi:hypothetical protein